MDAKYMLTKADAAMTVAWFAMDICWKKDLMSLANGFAFMALILMAFTLFLSMTTSDAKELFAQSAAGSWLLMNVLWMLGETDPMMNTFSDIFMWLGITIIVLMFIFFGGALDVFRRFRMGKRP